MLKFKVILRTLVLGTPMRHNVFYEKGFESINKTIYSIVYKTMIFNMGFRKN